jgi:hypothetical protein
MDILAQLRSERDKAVQQVNALETAIRALSGLRGSVRRAPRGRLRKRISARGLANIRAAQRAGWAKARGMQVTPVTKAGTRTMSVAARRKIAASQRTRWAKIKAGKK